VRFHSYVPNRRAQRFGLPARCNAGVAPFAAPGLAWQRFLPRFLPGASTRALEAGLNFGTILRLAPCDVFICMSGIYLEGAAYARRRYGAQIWLHRGSRHILSQDEILADTPGAERPTAATLKRELAGYRLADRIVVQARHVVQSFERDPEAMAKLIRIPTGTDLGTFRPAPPRRASSPVALLFVGTWSLRKGCDTLAEAIGRTPGVTLTHVGTRGDLAFPTQDWFRSLGRRDQKELPEAYAQADAVVLPSREEGLSQVLIQALASGVPIICSDRSGGADLAHTPSLAERITEVPVGDTAALASALALWRDRLLARELPPIAEVDRRTLGWRAYGERYDQALATFARHSVIKSSPRPQLQPKQEFST
jgi:glycosyltransferase involved in cell wall biosynthesis